MTSHTVKAELAEYAIRLSNVKTTLQSYIGQSGTCNLLTDQAQVLLLATEGLLIKLSPRDLAEQVDLNNIVMISDEVHAVLTSTARFLERRRYRIAEPALS
jgi:hypothetical protein